MANTLTFPIFLLCRLSARIAYITHAVIIIDFSTEKLPLIRILIMCSLWKKFNIISYNSDRTNWSVRQNIEYFTFFFFNAEIRREVFIYIPNNFVKPEYWYLAGFREENWKSQGSLLLLSDYLVCPYIFTQFSDHSWWSSSLGPLNSDRIRFEVRLEFKNLFRSAARTVASADQ